MVAVLGHLDVVQEGEGWHYPPYGGVIENGKYMDEELLITKIL